MQTTAKPKLRPPAHLRAPTKKWWASVASEYQLDSQHYHLLTLACEALDRAEVCREAIEKEGMTIEGLHGRRAHPLLSIERDSRLAYARLLKQLNLSDDDNHDRPGRGRK